jgi:hypothetical protein
MKACAFSTLLLAEVPCDILSSEVFLIGFCFLVSFHREYSEDSVV